MIISHVLTSDLFIEVFGQVSAVNSSKTVRAQFCLWEKVLAFRNTLLIFSAKHYSALLSLGRFVSLF